MSDLKLVSKTCAICGKSVFGFEMCQPCAEAFRLAKKRIGLHGDTDALVPILRWAAGRARKLATKSTAR